MTFFPLRTLLLASVLLLASGALAAEPAKEAGAAKGRTVRMALPTGAAQFYLPPGHDLSADRSATVEGGAVRSWPLLVFLPGFSSEPGEALESWRKLADATGLIVAVPVPCKPDPARGYPDLAVIGMVRAAVEYLGADPDRVALVGNLSGGFVVSAEACAFPRLARAAVIVGSVPAPVPVSKDLSAKVPPMLFLAGKESVLEKIRARKKEQPGLSIEVVQLAGAEDRFDERFANRALEFVSGHIPLGVRTRPAAPRSDDPAAAAELVAEARKNLSAGAGAGAYLKLLRAAELSPGSVDARLELARLSLAGRRLEEAADWARSAAKLEPQNAPAHLIVGQALLELGRARQAMEELSAAGEPGRRLAKLVAARIEQLEVPPGRAGQPYARAVAALSAGDLPAAAAAAREAVKAAPAEAACRVLAAYAIFAAEGLPPARRELADYLELFPDDPHIAPLSAALSATAETDYSSKSRRPKAEVEMGRRLPVGPAAASLAALAVKVGRAAEEEELARSLTAAGADDDLRAALPLLVDKGFEVRVGRGSLDDLRTKLAGGIAVLVQMPPGEMAGLREGELYSSGVPRLAVGYDDGAKCVLLLDAGASAPLRVPYGLFDLLWSRVDRWWLTLTPAKTPPPGLAGDLTLMELSSGYALGRDYQRALETLEKPDAGKADGARWHLAKGMMLWRLGRLELARAELAALREAPVEISLQAELTLGAIEEQSAPPGERSAKALEHYRRAWSSDPANEGATLTYAMVLAGRGATTDVAEARRMLEHYLKINPLSMASLMLLYRL